MGLKSRVFTNRFVSWAESVPALCDAAALPELIRSSGRSVLIKPNLVENLAPPITTPIGLVSVLVDYLRERVPEVTVLIGEGCGSTDYDTGYIFAEQGYTELAQARDLRLVDLNQEPLRHLENSQCQCWPQMHLPELLFDVFLLSVPVLKAHSLAGVTLTMKNMMGAAPPRYFQQGGAWKKAAFHAHIHPAIFDLNTYRTPDFTLLDATVGMQQAHLWGPTCSPPKNRLAAADDPVAIDVWGTTLLGFDWQRIGYLTMADNVLGTARYEECSL
ncbi:MAG: hypothetical protein C0613_00420 [Desulfobulbaceae bacterium]|nr:MAG: hypothetical protein C0613_00420 [Desulfobulbaceae bacterium]